MGCCDFEAKVGHCTAVAAGISSKRGGWASKRNFLKNNTRRAATEFYFCGRTHFASPSFLQLNP